MWLCSCWHFSIKNWFLWSKKSWSELLNKTLDPNAKISALRTNLNMVLFTKKLFCFTDDLSNSNSFLLTLTRNKRCILHNDYYWQSGGSKFDGPSNLWSARIFSELKKDLIVSNSKREICKTGVSKGRISQDRKYFFTIFWSVFHFNLDYKIESLNIFDLLISLPFSCKNETFDLLKIFVQLLTLWKTWISILWKMRLSSFWNFL